MLAKSIFSKFRLPFERVTCSLMDFIFPKLGETIVTEAQCLNKPWLNSHTQNYVTFWWSSKENEDIFGKMFAELFAITFEIVSIWPNNFAMKTWFYIPVRKWAETTKPKVREAQMDGTTTHLKIVTFAINKNNSFSNMLISF